MAYVMPGFWIGTYPPGRRNLQLGMQTLANIMACHTNVYQKLKKLPHGNVNQIGIVKEYHQMDVRIFYYKLIKNSLCKF